MGNADLFLGENGSVYRHKAVDYAGVLHEVFSIDPYYAFEKKAVRRGALSEDDYFEYIYVERALEENVKKVLTENAGKLTCLIGPRGSGKSSVGRKIKREYEAKEAFFHFYDIRREQVNHCLGEHDEALSCFSEIMKNAYWKKLKDVNSDSLYAFMVNASIEDDYRPSDSPTFDVFSELAHDVDQQILWDKEDIDKQIKEIEEDAEKTNLTKEREVKEKNAIKESLNVESWFKYCRMKNARDAGWKRAEIEELFNKIREKIQVVHLAYAYRYLKKYEGEQIFWFDNIDNLKGPAQETLVNALDDLQQTMSQIITIVVAAREENVFRPQHFYDEGRPLTRTLVFFDDPHALSNGSNGYEAVNISVVSWKEIRQIVERRMAYFEVYYNARKRRTLDRFDIRIFRKIREVMDFLLHPSGDSSNEAGIFQEEKITFVANNSLRELLPMFADFTKFILEKYDTYCTPDDKRKVFLEFPPFLNDGRSFKITELLYWLSRRQEYFKLHNLVSYLPENPSSKGSCLLPHVILTCIWNLVENQRIDEHDRVFVSPTIKAVVDKLSLLGFTKEEVLKELFRLYRPRVGRSHIVVIETRNHIGSWGEIKLDYRVRITARGKVALNRVFNSFGYFYAMITDVEPDLKGGNYTLPANRLRDGRKFLKYLIKMYFAHLNAFRDIKTKYEEHPSSLRRGETWLGAYYRDFGILIDPVLTRKQRRNLSSAVTIGSKGYILFFPYLVECVLNYFEGSGDEIKKSLEALLARFNNYVERFEKGEEVGDIELPDEVSLSF